MTFHEILQKLVEGTPGALAAAIMGDDGIPVDEYAAPRSHETRDGVPPGRIDLPTLAVEFQRVVQDARKTTLALAAQPGGALQELILISEQHQLLFRQIDDEYSVVVAISLTGSLGKARYLVRSLLQELREEL